MLDWSSAAGQLLRDGPQRGARVLDLLASGVLPARVDLAAGGAEQQERLRGRALRLAGAAFAGSLLMTAGPRSAGLGMNLWTAELVFVGAALVLLVGALHRLTRSAGAER